MDDSIEPAALTLHCLGGAAAPQEIADDLLAVTAFPDTARLHFWDALGPCLGEPLPRDADERLQRFCQIHGVPDGELARAIKAARFLLRRASALDLEPEQLGEDLHTLGDPRGELGALLMAGYDAAKKEIRAELLRATLADHGKVLEGIDHRVDVIASSNHGEGFRTPIAVLTLRYSEGERRERVTLHVTGELLAELRELCDRLLR